MDPLFFGILWGILFTHNFENSNLYKCNVEKNQQACALIELKK
jgi:hypothetical protein